MDVMPGGILLALYALTAVCAVALVTVWVLLKRSRRNAGFARKGQLKRQLSAKAVLRATEIRPSLTHDDGRPARASGVSFVKDGSADR
ncbi:hypothetical protein [Streptomyces sp. 891-h]|uniref:hypothetical protein n=1 Tax=Streptomyces sp. 891-h TaxID=2720714 RepID=UPI001FA9A47E|nr:hypothetical protein [Streptomyces sp. 891-h]UNZ18181.1 hypothetical protein HC362_15145 [Streptomyces sp. 891-h]